MTTIHVFDPAMCCSSGVCGPSVDPALSRFAADLDWLASQDVRVTRYNLAQEPGAFVAQPLVTAVMERDGDAALPAIVADGRLVSEGRYPDRVELADWAGLRPKGNAVFVYGDEVASLVAVAATVAANGDTSLGATVDAARRLGIPDAEISRAVATAVAIKDAVARAIGHHAGELLGDPSAADTSPVGAGCCEPPTAPVEFGRRDAPASSTQCC